MTAKDGTNPFLAPSLLFLIVSATCIELALQGADAGLWGSSRLRPITYQNTAFWPGLLKGWIPNYEFQPTLMFLTYAFVHAGFVHLLVNMITLVSLGGGVVREVGEVRFLTIYAVSALVGAGVFVILTQSYRPMVGASGALFGLAGALILWNIIYAFRHEQSLSVKVTSVVWPIGVLVILNVLMFVGFDKSVAWETHLGGFLGGVFAAAFMVKTALRDTEG